MRYLLRFLNPVKVVKLIRYRFFLFAGLLPFFLGQAVAYGLNRSIDSSVFWWGLSGIFSVLTAVELFNEYFDAKEGGDRIFSQRQFRIPNYFYGLGILALCFALSVGFYLAWQTGWPVLVFCFFGFMGAYFYVGPPIRWAYRGFGEIVIGLCYGPFMVMGSYYIQTQRLDFVPFFVSLIIGLSVFCLAVLNEIPDYYQDVLVGKRNLVVRFGKEKAMILLKAGLVVVFVLLAAGIGLGVIAALAIIALVIVPFLLKALRVAQNNYDNPRAFLFAVNTMVITHVVLVVVLAASFLLSSWG
jgi:1,4-dihydroxy-2-naphthoate octaprenyltransferase